MPLWSKQLKVKNIMFQSSVTIKYHVKCQFFLQMSKINFVLPNSVIYVHTYAIFLSMFLYGYCIIYNIRHLSGKYLQYFSFTHSSH